jgi:HSP20 family protein
MTKTLTKPELVQQQPIRRWFEMSPLAALRQEMDDLFESFFTGRPGLPTLTRELVPRLDVVETANAIEVTTDLPGFKPEEVKIDLGDNYLTISGEHLEETQEEGNGKKFHRIERQMGSFSRSVWLPCAVKDAKVEAELKEGVLKVTLPKTEEAKHKRIVVKG